MTKRAIIYVTVCIEAEMDQATTLDDFVNSLDYNFESGLVDSSVINTEIRDFDVVNVV